MRRVGELFETVAGFENLLAAFHAAARAKADRTEVRDYREHLHERTQDVRRRLLGGTFAFGGYRVSTIHDPKTRTIQAAPFEQRVVHHAMVRVAGPALERSLIFHTYACRTGKGQHAAAHAAQRFCRQQEWYLKMDIERFYDSVRHDRLLALVARRIKDQPLLDLIAALVASYHREPGAGLPIGNLTSQYLGNLYLDSFDHWVTETQRAPGYVRYMDDMVVWGSHASLRREAGEARDWLRENLGLRAKHGGELNRCARGLPFVGWVVYPSCLRLGKGARTRFGRKLRALERAYRAGTVGERELQVRGTALCAAVCAGDTRGLRAAVAARGMVLPGYA